MKDPIDSSLFSEFQKPRRLRPITTSTPVEGERENVAPLSFLEVHGNLAHIDFPSPIAISAILIVFTVGTLPK
jgi:hypothetical protein